MLELCNYIIHRTELHEKDTAENVLKFNDLLLSFLSENHSRAIKLIKRTTCNVYFKNAKKHVNNQVRREVVEQFKQTQRKRQRK